MATLRPLEVLSDLWDDDIDPVWPSQLLIFKCRARATAQALQRFKEATQSVSALSERLQNCRSLTLQAKELIAAPVGSASQHSSSTLAHAHNLQRARDDVRARLQACAQYKELLVLSDIDAQILSGVKYEPLSCLYFAAFRRLTQKQANAQLILRHLERNGRLTFPLEQCLSSAGTPGLKLKSNEAPDEAQDAPQREPLPLASIRVASELEDLAQTVCQTVFQNVLMWSYNLLPSLVDGKQYATKAETLKLFFSRQLFDQAVLNKFPTDEEEQRAKEARATEKTDAAAVETEAAERILHFYRAVFVLQSKPHFFVQCLRSVATLRANLLRYHFCEALEDGIRVIGVADEADSGPQMRDSLSARTDTTGFFGNIFAWIHQAARNEAEFAAQFLSALPSLKEFIDKADEADLGSAEDFVNFVFTEGLLVELHSALRKYLPFTSSDVLESLAAADEQMSVSEQNKLLQSVLSDPVAVFDKIYLLDFYLEVLPRALRGARLHSSTIPMLVRYLIHLRENFFDVLKNALEARSLALQELAAEEMTMPWAIPSFVTQSVHFTRDLVRIFEQQILIAHKRSAEGVKMDDERVIEFNDILDRTYTPVINLCRTLAIRLPLAQGAVVSVNSYSLLLASLKSPQELQTWCPCFKHLELLMEESLEQVVTSQVELTLEKLGLPPSESVCSEAEISGSLLRLCTAFTGPSGSATFSLITKISSRVLRDRARRLVLSRLAEVYTSLHAQLSDVAEETVLRDPLEVRALLLADL